MGGIEILAVVVFFLVGYWAVDFFWPKKKVDSVAVVPSPMASNGAPGEYAPWHEVLGVPPDASLEQIRKAYEEMSTQYHPGRVAGMGPEVEQAAIRMTRRINDAYSEATRER